jgi:hypothetical protein
LKLKRLSIFFVFIIFVSLLSFNYHHRENRIFQDDSLIFDTVGDNLDFSTCNKYQALLTSRFVITIIIIANLIAPRISTCKLFTRDPPA